MKGFLFNRWTQLLLRLIIGGIFIYAGVLKERTPQEFADNIAAYQLLPAALINLVALGLPFFEIMIGLMLIIGFRLRLAACSTLLLILVFAIALASALARGLNIDCGCFGDGKPSAAKTWLALVRDLSLGGAAYIVFTAVHSQDIGFLSGAPKSNPKK